MALQLRNIFLKLCFLVHSWPGREILNLKSKQKHFEVGWKRGMLRLFSPPKRLDGLSLFQLHSAAPQKCRELKQLRSSCVFVRDYILYLCEILFHICPEITFCNLRCDNQANFPPHQQRRLDKCHFDDDEHLGFVIGYELFIFVQDFIFCEIRFFICLPF